MYVRSATLTSQLLDAFLVHESVQYPPTMTTADGTVLLFMVKVYHSAVERWLAAPSIINRPTLPHAFASKHDDSSGFRNTVAEAAKLYPNFSSTQHKQWKLPPDLSAASLTNSNSPSS
jgi:hypothetical protein